MPDVLDPLRGLGDASITDPEPVDLLRSRTARRRRRQRVVLAVSGAFLVAVASVITVGAVTRDDEQDLVVDDPPGTETTPPTSSPPETSPTVAGDPIAVGDLPGPYVRVISGPAGILVTTSEDALPHPSVWHLTGRPTLAAFGVGQGRIVAQYATTGVPSPIVVLDGQGEHPIAPPSFVDAGGGVTLLDAGFGNGRPMALITAYGGANPAQWDVRLLVVDLETLEQTDLGSVGGWEEGVDEARLLGNGDVVALLGGTGAPSELQRRTPGGDVPWTVPDLGDGTADSFTGTMTVDGGTVLVAEYAYDAGCSCSQVRLRRFDVTTGEQIPLERDMPEGEQVLTLHGPDLHLLDGACTQRLEAVDDGIICSISYEFGPIHIDRDGLVSRLPGAHDARGVIATTWRLDT
jgi:hypothetical protein